MKNHYITLLISIALFVVAATNAWVNYQQNRTMDAVIELVQTNYDLAETQYQLNKQRIENVSIKSAMTYEALDYAMRKGVKFD